MTLMQLRYQTLKFLFINYATFSGDCCTILEAQVE
jgi:hypothetical protein